MFVKLIYSFLPIFIRFPKLGFCGVLPCVIYNMSKFVWIVLADATVFWRDIHVSQGFRNLPKGCCDIYLSPFPSASFTWSVWLTQDSFWYLYPLKGSKTVGKTECMLSMWLMSRKFSVALFSLSNINYLPIHGQKTR